MKHSYTSSFSFKFLICFVALLSALQSAFTQCPPPSTNTFSTAINSPLDILTPATRETCNSAYQNILGNYEVNANTNTLNTGKDIFHTGLDGTGTIIPPQNWFFSNNTPDIVNYNNPYLSNCAVYPNGNLYTGQHNDTPGNNDLLIKMDDFAGNNMFCGFFGENNGLDEVGYSIMQDSQGDIIAVGSISNGGGTRVYVVALDQCFNPKFIHHYDLLENAEARSVTEVFNVVSPNGQVLPRQYAITGQVSEDVFLLFIDPMTGLMPINMYQRFDIDNNSRDIGNSIITDGSGDVVIAGTSISPDTSNPSGLTHRPFVLRYFVNGAGYNVKKINIAGSPDARGNSIVMNHNEEFVLAGTAFTEFDVATIQLTPARAYLLKIDMGLNFAPWTHSYLTPNYDRSEGKRVTTTEDEALLLSGSIFTNVQVAGTNDYAAEVYLVKPDDDGYLEECVCYEMAQSTLYDPLHSFLFQDLTIAAYQPPTQIYDCENENTQWVQEFCDDGTPQDSICAVIVNDSIYCDPTTGDVFYTFQVQNTTSPAFPINSLVINPLGSATYTPNPISIPTLAPTNTSAPITVQVTGAVALSTECFTVTVHEVDINTGQAPTNHCTTDTVCVVIPDCSTPPSDCADIIQDYVYCDNFGNIFYTFQIHNTTSPPFPINSFVINNVSGTATFTPNPMAIPTLAPTNISAPITVQLTGTAFPNVECFTVTVHEEDITTGQLPTNCCTTDTICINIPECPDPCDNVSVDAVDNGGDCCYDLTVNNGFANNFFTSVSIKSITPGVYFAAVSANTPNWALNTIVSPTEYELDYVGGSGYIPMGSTLVGDFCLSGYTTAFQQVEVSWWTLDSTGKYVVCTDTLDFFCPPPPPEKPCAEMVDPSVKCDSLVAGQYILDFKIANNTHLPPYGPIGHDFTDYHLSIQPGTTSGITIAPSGLQSLSGNTPYPLTPGSVTSNFETVNILGGSPGDTICLKLTGHSANMQFCCTTDSIYCFILPPCCEEEEICDDFNDNDPNGGSLGNWQTIAGSASWQDNGQNGIGDIFLQGNDGSGASWIYNSVDYPSAWVDSMYCEFCFDINYIYDGPFNNTSATGTVVIYDGTSPSTSTIRARFILNTPITSGGGWTTVCAPIDSCDNLGNLPSNADGYWTINTNDCNDWNTLINNINGIGFFLDNGSNPAEIWGYDNFCFKTCCDSIPPSDDCSCEQQDFYPDVDAGFDVDINCYDGTFTPIALTPCDSVTWTISQNGVVLVNSAFATWGNQPWTYTFPSAGIYEVCMYVYRTDPITGEICEYFHCKTVVVDECCDYCDINVDFDYTHPYCGFNFDFNNLTTINSDCYISGFFWSFGDGNTSTDPNPYHSYNPYTSHTVCLTVYYYTPFSNQLCQETICKQVYADGWCEAADCVPTIVLNDPVSPNPNVGGSLTNADDIIMDSEANLSGNNVILLQGGTSITLSPGFVATGVDAASFSAYIIPCNAVAPMQVDDEVFENKKDDSSNNLKTSIGLQAAPNPTNGMTRITFNTNQTTEAIVELFTLTGQSVVKLYYDSVNGEQDYQMNFDTSNVEKGVYILQLTTKNGDTQSLKLVVQ